MGFDRMIEGCHDFSDASWPRDVNAADDAGQTTIMVYSGARTVF